MNRKISLLIPLVAMLFIALGMALLPVSANSAVHPDIMAEGWAFAKTADGIVYGKATLLIYFEFVHPPLEESGEPVMLPTIVLEVCDHVFWWAINESTIMSCKNAFKMMADPCHQNEITAPDWTPASIKLIAYHNEPWWVLILGKGIFFSGTATC